MVTNIEKRAANKLIDMLWANKGHWVEFMHKSGTKFYLKKRGSAPFEKPEWDYFDLYIGDEKVQSSQKIEQIAQFLLAYGK